MDCCRVILETIRTRRNFVGMVLVKPRWVWICFGTSVENVIALDFGTAREVAADL